MRVQDYIRATRGQAGQEMKEQRKVVRYQRHTTIPSALQVTKGVPEVAAASE